ncbi:MAG TPA: hypothetical protein VI758_05445, partial [Bacteroidota bacterium]
MTRSFSQDSGRIQYNVIDSTRVNDTLLLWNLQEIHDFSSKRATSGPMSGVDTTYRSSDTVALVLEEHTTGKHEIKCSGIIWNFPFKHLRNEISVSVLRYADFSPSTLAWRWHDPTGYYVYGTGTDTARFDSAFGLSYRNFSETWS